MNKHNVFISYHHANDQFYKDYLESFNNVHNIFINKSVSIDDIDENLPADTIREIIRDNYLRDTSVLILLVGVETKNRKHVDWEIYSSMRNSAKNRKSGILVINLPSVGCTYFRVAHGETEKRDFYPNINEWISIDDRAEYERRYPYMPARIIDNLLMEKSYISIVNWNDIENDPEKLRKLIELTFQDRESCEYSLGRAMRERNG
ncbi:TIR domain-containing protein [Acinetobacter sp. ULE_I010]|uniref:TIR domain-containing protein n=1 Tax=Acinetobacter sp. ULE_I010 TaxID=3373065 RepID=UPI003AF5BD37